MATPVDRRLRLRHPLRQRPVPPDHPQRLAAGIPEDWLTHGNPWEFERPEVNYAIGFGGWVEAMPDGEDEASATSGIPARRSRRSAYDTPIVGWRGRHVNTLRLWSARAPDPLKLDAFNAGDYVGALSRHACAPKRSPRCSIRATRRRRARNCGCGRNISSPPPRCSISIAPPRQAARRHAHARPTRSRSSSTTPIRPSPSPN